MNAQQLKNSILQMAVQGKLVPQDPNDEPASVLLERIRKEKEKLIKEGKIKKEKNPSYIFRGEDNLPYEKIGKNESVCIADEVPFEIPDNWAWIRLAHVCEVARGGSPRPIKDFITDAPNGINWIKIGDSDKGGKYINSTKEKIKPEGVYKSRLVHAGDFLLTNSMSFGRPYILNVDGCIHDGWLVLSGYQNAYDKNFLFYMLSSRFAYYQFCGIVSGAVVKNLNSDKVAASIFPVPPLNEQKRIVKVIESIEPLLDTYNEYETKISNLQIMFPELLKKSILKQAVMGNLVPQDPNDEPVSVLLEKIRAEKNSLFKAGKLKKDKHKSIIYRMDNSYYEKLDGVERCIDDEIPFDIPTSWEWVRLYSISKKITDGTHNSPVNTATGDYLYISAKNIKDEGLSLSNVTFVTKEVHDEIYSRCNPEKGDVLLIKDGATTGVVTVNDLSDPFSLLSSVALIKLSKFVNPWYLVYVLRSDIFQKNIKSQMKGTGITRLTLKQIEPVLIPIPPLQEQNRIVTKIVELMPCYKMLN